MPLAVLFTRTPGFVSLTNWFMYVNLDKSDLGDLCFHLMYSSMSQFGILYNVPLYFSAVEQTSTSYAGLHLIPNAVLASTASSVHRSKIRINADKCIVYCADSTLLDMANTALCSSLWLHLVFLGPF